jgi:hypothetical protein
MPTFEFTSPEGKKYEIQGPEGATKEQAFDILQSQLSAQQRVPALPGAEDTLQQFKRDVSQGAGNLAAGLVRGAGSIGATLKAPFDYLDDAIMGDRAGKVSRNEERRRGIDSGLKELGAEPDSALYGLGKLGGEVAGTAGIGAVAALPAKAMGLPRLGAAIETAGFRTGAQPATAFAGKAADLGIRTAGGAITGAAAAGLVNPSDATTGAAIGGALPGAAKAAGSVGVAIGRKVAGKQASPEVVALAQRAKELGIDIPVDRITNSKPLNAVAAGLNYVPLSGRAGTERKMQDQLNRALSRTFGQDSDNVTMALRKAQDDLGGKFDDVLKNNKLRLDQQLIADLDQSAQQAASELNAGDARIIINQINDLKAKAIDGVIDGQAAYNVKKTLDRIGRRQSNEAYYALDVKRSLMEGLDRSLGAEEAKAFAKTRQQYGNMLSLEKLAQNGVEGDISTARLANMKNINNKDLQELADISAQFLKAREGQHGAAQRAAAGLGVGGFVGLPALAGTIAAGRATNALMNSNTVRSAALGQPLTRAPRLAELVFKTAPVVGSQ